MPCFDSSLFQTTIRLQRIHNGSNRFTAGIIGGALSVGLILVACFVHARPRRHPYRDKTAGDRGGAQAAGKSK